MILEMTQLQPPGSAVESRERSDQLIRIALIVYAVALLVLAAGFAFGAHWAHSLWPFDYTSGLSFTFVASIIAAAAASTLWCAVTRNLRALVGGGIDAMVITLPIATYALILGRKSLRMFALAAIVTAVVALLISVRYWRYRFQDTRPTPVLVRISFVLFILALGIPGVQMIAGNTRILPWDAPREVTIIYGWAFIGSAVYFVYGLIFPNWSNAMGQLFGTIAYDAVLIGPLISLFYHVANDRRLSLIIYVAAVLYSGVIAIYFLLLAPESRVFGAPHQRSMAGATIGDH
jgi:hypothetical protein